MHLKHLLLAGVVLTAAALPVWADDAPRSNAGDAAAADLFAAPKPAPAVTPQAPAASQSPFVLEPVRAADKPAASRDPAHEVDLSALRYYASQNDLTRVAAEIRLLRSQHPDWEPPQDLFSDTRSTADEQPLWDTYGKHDMAALHAAVEAFRQKNPDWQPSADLAGKIRLAEAREQLVAASNGKRWADAVDVAANNRGLLTCGDVDSLWRTAEALTQSGDETRAIDAYRYILTTCDNTAERLATVQKASAVLTTPGAVETLTALGRKARDGRSEFDVLRLDGLRSRIGEAAAGKPGAQVASADVDQLAAHATSARSVGDAQLLGWYHYNRKAFAESETWFRAALAIKPDPKSTEGLALTLREQGKLQEALDLASQSRDLGPDNSKVFVQIVSGLITAATAPVAVKPDQLAAFTATVDASKDAAGAQAYGWSLMKAKQVAQAEPWFQKSMTWQPSQDAAIGLLVSAKQLGHARVAADLMATYRTQYVRLAELDLAMRPRGGDSRRVRSAKVARGTRSGGGWDANADAIISTYKAGRYDDALAMMDTRRGTKAEPRGLSIVRGWAQYQRGDWEGAQRTFGALQQQGPSDDAEKGLRVIRQGYLPPALR